MTIILSLVTVKLTLNYIHLATSNNMYNRIYWVLENMHLVTVIILNMLNIFSKLLKKRAMLTKYEQSCMKDKLQ